MKWGLIYFMIAFIFLTSIFLINSVLAMQVTFYYSESCPYCRQIKPVVMELANTYPTYIFGIYDTANPANYEAYMKEGFTGVPAFIINPDDGREIRFTGADERKLRCELQEMSTKDCPTYSAEESCVDGSWFI